MNAINLKLLQTFLVTAESGSFRAAANRAGRSPSAISMQIKELEKQIGATLFHRGSADDFLTESGKVLFEKISRSMSEISSSLEFLSDDAQRKREIIKIGCAPTLASTRLPGILGIFKERYPNSSVYLREISTAKGIELIQKDEIEFYIGPSIDEMQAVDFEPIASDPLVACFPPRFDKVGQCVTLSELKEFPLVMLSNSTAARSGLNSLLQKLNVHFVPQFEVEQAFTALGLAASGLGVAILPRIATSHASTLQLRCVLISDAKVAREIGIARKSGYIHHDVSIRLMDLIRAQLSNSF